MSSEPDLSKSYAPPTTATMSTRKRKPIVTYQSPNSGVLDMALLIRNTTLELEAAAVMAAASRSSIQQHQHHQQLPTPSTSTSTMSPVSSNSSHTSTSDSTYTPSSQSTKRFIPSSFQPITLIPRAPHPLYHPLSSRPNPSSSSSKQRLKNGQVMESGAPSSSSGETGRRSSSRTRRPAPKMRETEGGTSPGPTPKDIPPEQQQQQQQQPSLDNKSNSNNTPNKRRRGGVGGKRKRGGQQDPDGDSAYPAVKRTRKQPQQQQQQQRNVDGDGDSSMPPPSTDTTSPPTGYPTRARRPRTTAPQVMKDDSGSEGTGSATRTTPVNSGVEEFWVPTK